MEDAIELSLSQLNDLAHIMRIAFEFLSMVGNFPFTLALTQSSLTKVDTVLSSLHLLLLLLQPQVGTQHFHEGRLTTIILLLQLQRNHKIIVTLIACRGHVRVLIKFISQQPLEHSLMIDYLIGLNRQYEDVIVHLIKFIILFDPHLRVDVPQQDQILEDDDVWNTDVQLELSPVIIAPCFYLILHLTDDVLQVGTLEDALARPANLSQAALANMIAAKELVLSRQVEKRWQYFDVERVITVNLRLLEAVNPEDTLHAESVLLEHLLEERP